MSIPEVSAIIVNYNAGAALGEALHSLGSGLSGTAWDAIVIDNDSTDGSVEQVGAFSPMVRVIRNRENVGFGKAVNQALDQTRAPLVLIMNPDCRLVTGTAAALAWVLEQNPTCAIVGPRILNPDGSVQGSARGDPDMLTGLFGRSSLLRRVFPWLPIAKRNVVTELHPRGEAQSVVIDWVSGACMLARRDALALVGGFDERYFLYWEDADLCRRLRARGFQIRYAPGATAIHRVGQSSRTAAASSVRAFHESAYIYYATHVAPRARDPKRGLARALLTVRCWFLLRKITPASPRSR